MNKNMTENHNQQHKNKYHFFKDFWRFIKPYKSPLRIVYILYFINSVLNLIPALSVRFYIDVVLLQKQSDFLGLSIPAFKSALLGEKIFVTVLYGAAMIILIVIANTIGVIMWRKNAQNVEKVVFDIRVELLNHIEKLSLGYFQSQRVGAIMTRAVGDVSNVSELLKNSFNLSYGIVQFILTPFLLIALSPILFLVVLIPVPLIAFAFYSIRIKLMPMYRMQRENEELINSRIQETVSGIREIKAFNMESASFEAYRDINMKFYTIQNKIMKVFSFNHQLQYGSKDLAVILIAVTGGLLIFGNLGGVTIGTISSFLILSNYLFLPISQFISFFDIIQRGMVSLERIILFLSVNPDVKDKKGAREIKKESVLGKIVYDDVSFSYDKVVPVLEHVSLSITPGEKIAVVGKSGSGKSTLVSLLLRFYEINAGKISLDGIDITDVKQSSLRRNIGIVFQETFLFYGSIRDNLLFASPGKSEDDLVSACKAANIYDTIESLPEGFDTMIGERGTRLSGGQRQRIAIARVFLKDPNVVILDEATASVDTITESLIQESIAKVLEGRTAIIIAHRLSTIKNCDKIIVLDNKSVAETGTHDELLEKRRAYFELYTNNLL
jgi:ATP-binding cassette subfamily B protein